MFHYIQGKAINERVIGIGIKQMHTNEIYPSPITNYIRNKYRRKTKSLSSQRNAAYELIKFLNYVRDQIKQGHEDFITLRYDGVFGLKLIHGSHYITHMSIKTKNKELSSNYVYRMEGYLINFYKWLTENQIISEPINFEVESPFNSLNLETIYPGREENVSSRLVDFGENRYDLVLKFIKIAQNESPDIALGICFQLFGGLRLGEVVNLTKNSIQTPYYWNENDFGEKKFILQIRDRTIQLFPQKKNTAHEQVKKPRDQALLVNPVLSKIYKEHKLFLKRMENRNKVKNKDALFVCTRTGNAISGSSYQNKFKKIQKSFLNQLSQEGRVQDYLFLTDKEWSTHICRGIFTNFLLQINASIPEIAIARGDKSITSMMKYVEEKNALELTKEALNNIQKAYKSQQATIKKTTNNNFTFKEGLYK